MPDAQSELMILAQAVKARREELGMAQDDLAAKADVSRSTIQNIEGAHRDPRPSSLRRIAAALQTDVATLRRREPEPIRQMDRAEIEAIVADLSNEERAELTAIASDLLQTAQGHAPQNPEAVEEIVNHVLRKRGA